MQHLCFLLYILSLCTGMVAITASLLFYTQYRRKVVIYFSLLLGTVLLLVSSRMIVLYQVIALFPSAELARGIGLIMEKAAYCLGLAVGPHFAFYLIGLRMTPRKTFVFGLLTVLYAALTIAELLPVFHQISEFIRLGAGLVILFGTYIFLCILGAVRLRTVGDRILGRVLVSFFVLSIVLLPFTLYKYIYQTPFLPYHIENPLSLLCVTVLSIVFAFIFFNKPPFLEKGGLSDYFKKRYSLTDREQEIIAGVLQGLSNSQISEKMFISTRTVESHLYNIFQKTAIKSRVQLVNLILTNSREIPNSKSG
jgi:DNA-binding CsgD family transcriptional regulator